MRYSYPAYFIKKESGYLVFFPDLDNIATCGCNFAQATHMAMDCLALYLCSCLEDGKMLPPPSPIESLHLSDFLQNELNDIPYSDAFCQMICVDTDEYEQALHAGTAQVLVELPDFLLREIDDNNLDLNEQIFFALEERLYKNKSPNAQTLAAIEDVNNNRNLFGSFKNVEDMMNELNGGPHTWKQRKSRILNFPLKSEDTLMSPAIRLIWAAQRFAPAVSLMKTLCSIQ